MNSEHAHKFVEREQRTVSEVERELHECEERIHVLLRQAKEARQALDAEDKKLHAEFALDMNGIQEAWQSRCAPLLRAAKEAEKAMKAAIAEHRDACNQAVEVVVPDGEFEIEASYSARSQTKTHTFRISLRAKSLAQLLQEVRGYTVGEGLHNFGFVADSSTKVGEVALRMKNGGFSFETKCWLDQGGQLVE